MKTNFQDEARKANAQKSTGPRTPEGKAKSRVNNVRHGLAGNGTCLTAELQAIFDERRLEAGAKIDHLNEHSVRLEDELLLASMRVDACRRARYKAVTERWDSSHEMEALELAGKLRRDPELNDKKLERTAQGVAWKLKNLEDLIGELETNQALTAEQLGQAYDLLGVPIARRRATLEADDAPYALELLRKHYERLTTLRDEVLLPTEEEDKTCAMLGVPVNETKELTLLRRYERENSNKYFRLAEKLGLQVRKGPALASPKDQAPVAEGPTVAKQPPVEEPSPVIEACLQPSSEEVNVSAPVLERKAPEGRPQPARRDEPGDRTRGLSGSRESSGSSGSSTRMSATDVMRLRFSKKPQTPIRKK